MMVLFEAVIQHGTAGAAAQLNHALGGKTGTTNNYTDAWFVGFSPSITCGTWVGFDSRQSLGEKETGARAALPIWLQFMKVAIANKPNEAFPAANAPKRQIQVPVEKSADAAPTPSSEPPAASGPTSQPGPAVAPEHVPERAILGPGELRYPKVPVATEQYTGQPPPAPIVRMPPKPAPARRHPRARHRFAAQLARQSQRTKPSAHPPVAKYRCGSPHVPADLLAQRLRRLEASLLPESQ